MKRFAILGHPVSHSRSPELHNAVFQGLGLEDHRYEFCDTEPDDLEGIIEELRNGDYQGFSVTIPYKKKMMEYCDELSERAKKVGAVNTLLLKDSKDFKEGAVVVFGDNTDYLGFEKSLSEAGCFEGPISNGQGPNMKALVLGAGGAAKAVVAVLVDHGYEVVVASRRKDSKEHKDSNECKGVEVKHYDELDPEGAWGIIVNTTPVGMKGQGIGDKGQTLLLEDDAWYNSERVYVDIVYTPKMTPFLLKAQEAGGKIVTGDRMFLWQAVEQAKMFTNASEKEILAQMQELM